MQFSWTEHSREFSSFSGFKLLASQGACLNDFAGMHAKLLQSCPTLCDPMDCSLQAPLSMEFSGKEYWSGLPFPSPGGSSQPTDWTWVSCTVGGQFSVWATREAPGNQHFTLCFYELSFLFYFVLHINDITYHALFDFSSVTQSCPTLCDSMDCSTPGLPVHHQLPEFTKTHVHRVGDGIQPSHPLSSPSPPAFNLSQHQGLFEWVSSLPQVAKMLEPRYWDNLNVYQGVNG